MGKSDAEVIALFNEQVNMTADELEAWLDDPQSRKAGTGVGIESGRRIVDILRKNPSKNPDGYDEEDVAHIRKVVSYNSRHLAQEDHLKETKTTEELEKAKSTISLKNWGHDPVKVKIEREAGGGTEDNADEGSAPDKEASPEAAAEEDADGLGEPDDTHVEPGSESVEDADTGGKRKRGVEHRDRDNTGGKGEKDETSVGQSKRPHTDESGN